MIEPMSLAILVGALLVVLAIFTSFVSVRLGAPLLLAFLAVGLLAGSGGLGIQFENAGAAYFIGSVALALILFDAGFETRLTTVRSVAAHSFLLATVGVVVSAAIVSLAARLFFGFGWPESLLLGAIVSPTDAAAVFLLLRVGGITLRDRVRSTLELESGSNDPMAIMLTVVMLGIVVAPAEGGATVGGVFLEFVRQLGLGLVCGLAGGWLIVLVLRRTELEPGLYPIIVLALALVVFALTTLAGGSGFLAAYVAGLIAGNSRMPHLLSVRRFSNAITWLAQIAMFLLLGLLANPQQFGPVLLPSILLALVLLLLARPVSVWLCLAPFGFTRQEMAFIAWVGLRGAVSILLAILPRLSGLPDGEAMFNAAFIIVLASLLVQGWTVAPVARWFGLVLPRRLGPVQRIELELPGRGDHEILAYRVHPESPVAGGERIPRWARPSLVIRDGRTLKPFSAGRPAAGDTVYIVSAADYIPLLDRLFAAPAAGPDPNLYGEFAIAPEAPLAELVRSYDAEVAEADRALPVRDYLTRMLAAPIEPGDRVSLGPVDLIVRQVDAGHAIREVGLVIDPQPQHAPTIPFFQSPAEIAAWLRRLRGRLRRRSPAVSSGGDAARLPPGGEDRFEREEGGGRDGA